MTDKNSVISIVIPLYCEGIHLSEVLKIIHKELKFLKNGYELILVDDGSTDHTWTVIKEESKKYPIRAIRLSRNFGKESAICAGLEMVTGAAAIIMDADLQHPPKLIREMINEWEKSDVNIVEAVKIGPGKKSFSGRFWSNLFYFLLKKLSGFDLKGASDFKLIDRQVINAWLQMGERNLFFRGMIAWLGFKSKKINFAVSKRISGKSRWSFLSLIRLASTGLIAFSSLPLHIITLLGMVFFIFGIVLGGRTLFLWANGSAVSGFTTVVLLLLIIGSLLMVALGLIGTYIAKIYDETKQRPRFIVADSIEFKNLEIQNNQK